MPGRNKDRAFSGKSLWLFCNQNQSQTWGFSLLEGQDGTKHWVDATGSVVLWDRLGLITHGREVWALNLTQENIFFARSLNYSSGEEGLAQNVAEFSLSYPLQSFCSGSKTELPFLVCQRWRLLRFVHGMLGYPAGISIFGPLIRGSHSFPSAQRTSSVARLERHFLKIAVTWMCQVLSNVYSLRIKMYSGEDIVKARCTHPFFQERAMPLKQREICFLAIVNRVCQLLPWKY